MAATTTKRLNALHAEKCPGLASSGDDIAAFVPMDGYHLTRAQLDALPDPVTAHARRGAAFTFDGASFLRFVQKLREPLAPETKTLYAPSFDHRKKDPIADDIAIAPGVKIVVFEGNYLSLDEGSWREAAGLMDELWFVEVGFEVARRRLIERHVLAGIAGNEEEAARRADENDLVNGKEILEHRLEPHETVVSREDDGWKAGSQGEEDKR